MDFQRGQQCAIPSRVCFTSFFLRPTTGVKIEIHEIHQNLRNSVSINQNPPSAMKKSTYMKLKLSKSNVSSHKIKRFHEIQYAYEIHAFALSL